MVAISYIGAHWALIVSVLIGTAALGYVAFVLRNWKVAVAAIVLVCAGLAYQSADIGGYKRRVSEEAAREVKTLNARIAVLNKIADDDALRAATDQATIEILTMKSNETPPNSRLCLDVDAARRVWNIK